MTNSIIKTSGVVLICFFCFLKIQAQQQPTWQLYGQNKGSDVRLIWTRSEWPVEIEGIVVKRRMNGAAWQTLNNREIYPAISATKKLDNVTNNPARVAELNKKVADNPAQFNVDSVELIRVLSRGSGLKMFMFTLTKDYDFALITGLAYEEKGITAASGTKIEYGIFTKEKGILSATPVATWSYTSGKAADYNLQGSGTVKARKNKKEVRVTFSVPSDKIVAAKIIYGFNIYHTINGKRTLMTPKPALANVYEPVCKLPVVDTLSDMNQKVVYELLPVTMMGWELSPITVTYDPLQFPNEFTPALTSQYKDGDKSIAFSWTIPEQVLPFVDSIQLQEFNGGDAYNRIRSYTASTKNFYIGYDTNRVYPAQYSFRIVVFLKTDDEPVKSVDVPVMYNPNMNFEAVSGINGEYKKEGANAYILLKWKPVPGAAGYNLYLQDNATGKMFMEAKYGIITQTEFQFPVVIKISKSYTFSVAAVDSRGRKAGELKYVTTVVTPSEYLLRVWFKDVTVMQDSLAKVTWTYVEPDDVIGYRIYENGMLVTDQNVLKRGRIEWVSAPRKKGRYIYQIEAITLSGVVSPKSEPRTIEIK